MHVIEASTQAYMHKIVQMITIYQSYNNNDCHSIFDNNNSYDGYDNHH